MNTEKYVFFICEDKAICKAVQNVMQGFINAKLVIYNLQDDFTSYLIKIEDVIRNKKQSIIIFDVACSIITVDELADEVKCNRYLRTELLLVLMPTVDIKTINTCYYNNFDSFVIDGSDNDNEYLLNHILSRWNSSSQFPAFTKSQLTLSHTPYRNDISFEL